MISALLYDGYLAGEPDEAFQLYNPGARPVDLAGWRVSDGTRSAVFPPGLALAPGQRLWCASSAAAFRTVSGEPAGCAYGAAEPGIPGLAGGVLRFANDGGSLRLASPDGATVDLLIYGDARETGAGWSGPAAQPFRPTTAFAAAGQVLYRKPAPGDGQPLPDTDSAADWAGDPGDRVNGRRARYAGWDLETLFFPASCTAVGRLDLLVSPDNAHQAMQRLLAATVSSIRFEGYSLESPSLAATIAERAAAGVQVALLLEGAPPGGVADAQRWAVQRIAEAGGRVAYLRSDAATGIRKRYAFQHAKAWLLDDRLAVIGSENPSPEAFPNDEKADGTLGRRGVTLVTDAPCVVDRLRVLMALDNDPAAHRDVWAWDAADPALGAPPPDYRPPGVEGGSGRVVTAPAPLSVAGSMHVELSSAPEHALRREDGLLGLLSRAGAGDTVLVEQLYEHTTWGSPAGDSEMNPRLEAYVTAARRGARVRVLLDSFFDDLGSARSNLRTVEFLRAVAAAEGLDLQARRGNPTGQGIHNKMVLAQIGGEGWVMAGSLNGGEASAKLNREISLLVGSDEAYAYLADVFWYDWGATLTAGG
jgi:hypothetical protein